MPRVHDLQASFNAGELSPRLAARLDFAKYTAGLEICENLIPLSEGGVTRRPGTRYVAPLKSSSVKGRLKRFLFSTTQAYILEMGDYSMRFFKDQGQIVVLDTDAAVSNGDFTSNITGWDDRSTGGAGNQISHDAANGFLVLETSGTAADDIGWAEQDITTTATNQAHVIKFRVIGDPGDVIEFQVGTSSTGAQTLAATECETGYHCIAFTPTTSPFYIQFRNLGSNADKNVYIDNVSIIDGAAVEIETPWAEADLFSVEGPQSADVLYLFHSDTPTHKLERYGHTTWSLVEVEWQDGPYLDMNISATTMTPSATSGVAITVTASSVVGVNDGLGFQTTDVGRLIRIDNPASGVAWGWGIITARASTTSVTVHVKGAFSTTNADTRWALGTWSETTGYPQVSTFFEQRLYIANTTNQPQTLWASQVDDFENMKPDNNDDVPEADDAFSRTLSSDTVDAIYWMSAGQDKMMIGTAGGEWIPVADGIVLDALDITVKRQTTHGSARIQPVRIDNVVLFVQRAKRKIREFGFAFESDSFKAPDMTRLAQHITLGGIVEMDYAEEPESIVWIVRNDGQLISMTFRREEDVVGLGRHILGGSFGTGDAVVESVAVIPGSNGSGQVQDSTKRDEVWVTVKRTINESTVRYVEFFEQQFETGDDQEDAYYSDSLITYDGAAATNITGLSHLRGETVKILGDGAILDDETVSESGTVTLETAKSVCQIGLGYTHKLKTLKIASGNTAGTPVGKKKRIYGLTFVLLNSHTLSYGPDESNLQEKDFRVVTDAMDTAAPLFTGEKFVEFPGNWMEDARITIQSDDPVPFTLLAIAPEINLNPLK